MLKELENGRNLGMVRVFAWILKHQEDRINTVELSNNIGVSIPSVKSALKKLEGNILNVEIHGKRTRIYSVNKPALLQSLKEDGLCFCEERKAEADALQGSGVLAPESASATPGG